MSLRTPALVFVPGAWHRAACYNQVTQLLEQEHNLKCISVTLPSTTDNSDSTFKDDVDAVRNAVTSEIKKGRDVVVIAHSYGTMVGNSAIKNLTQNSMVHQVSLEQRNPNDPGHVKALVIIAGGFPIAGVTFMDPFLGKPPSFWRINRDTGFAELTGDTRDIFYHDLSRDEAEYWVSQLTRHSLKSLFEGGEHVYPGWQDIPTWYIGTIEDHGLPIVLQRVLIGAARGQGGLIHHVELKSSHSPFLSMPEDVVAVLLDVVKTVTELPLPKQQRLGGEAQKEHSSTMDRKYPVVSLTVPSTWLKYGIPLVLGRIVGWTIWAVLETRQLLRRR